MVRLTDIAHEMWKPHVQQGDVAIDATCGNGNDTFILSQLVGEEGTVIACDLQPSAIAATQQRCRDCENIEYHLGDHAAILKKLISKYQNKISVVTLNLGYLPGGDKSKTTQTKTTLVALDHSLELLKKGGMISVLAYVGHPGGEEEATAVQRKFQRWSQTGKIEMLHQPEQNTPSQSPRLFIVKKTA